VRILLLVLALTATVAADPVHKPSAPVAVSLASRAVQDGYVVTLVAVPTRAVPALELTLAGEHLRFGETAKGQRRELSMRIRIAAGEGRDVIGGALVAGRSKAAVLRVGARRKATPKRTTTRTLPDGREVEEVR